MDAQRLTRARILLRALAAALLVLAVLRPPETYAWSGAVCAIEPRSNGINWIDIDRAHMDRQLK